MDPRKPATSSNVQRAAKRQGSARSGPRAAGVAPLEEYRKKRKFDVTPEPAGRKPRARRREAIFVIQKHEASRLHYDFRLEIDGVLVSWAVPKGPSMNPADKRLAAQTEDHPLEYASFEGTIPKGQYGGGTVMVWDMGTFETDPQDPSAGDQLNRGELKFTLHGDKLNGGFVLIRTKSDRQWLLIKRRDASAKSSWNIERYNTSALTGRRMTEIAKS